MQTKWLLLFFSIVGLNLAPAQEISSTVIDAAAVDHFFTSHSAYAAYNDDIKKMYVSHPSYFWYNGNHVSEFGILMYKAACKIGEEGLPEEIPYRKELDKIFKKSGENAPVKQNDILLTCLYFYYTDKVFSGLPVKNSAKTGWNLPRERENYFEWLASSDTNKKDLISGKQLLFYQYYQLRSALQKYRKIAMNGGWETISSQSKTLLKPNDVSPVIASVRQRLFLEDYMIKDNHSNTFDTELLDAVMAYQEHHGMLPNAVINDALIASLNIPVAERIETIAVNMERCRWINPETESNYIVVNIPSFQLYYFQDDMPVFTSKVVVGKEMNKTVVFSGTLSQVIFNPYWNVPSSILKKEILPALKKNPNYLKQHHMEWHQGNVRQKPGNDNALGRVKFIFPNSNNIYLHDTPQKSLFTEEKRAFSHGCIRVEKACELAALLMQENFGWTESQTIEAMTKESQKVYILKKQLPVYIVYFTAWADKSGNVSFFNDVYKRDKNLAKMLFDNTTE